MLSHPLCLGSAKRQLQQRLTHHLLFPRGVMPDTCCGLLHKRLVLESQAPGNFRGVSLQGVCAMTRGQVASRGWRLANGLRLELSYSSPFLLGLWTGYPRAQQAALQKEIPGKHSQLLPKRTTPVLRVGDISLTVGKAIWGEPQIDSSSPIFSDYFSTFQPEANIILPLKAEKKGGKGFSCFRSY